MCRDRTCACHQGALHNGEYQLKTACTRQVPTSNCAELQLLWPKTRCYHCAAIFARSSNIAMVLALHLAHLFHTQMQRHPNIAWRQSCSYSRAVIGKASSSRRLE